MPMTPDDSIAAAEVKAKAAQKKKADAAARKKAAAEKAKAAASQSYEVRALRDPYRRAGLALGRNAITVADLSKDQLIALNDDPNVILVKKVEG